MIAVTSAVTFALYSPLPSDQDQHRTCLHAYKCGAGCTLSIDPCANFEQHAAVTAKQVHCMQVFQASGVLSKLCRKCNKLATSGKQKATSFLLPYRCALPEQISCDCAAFDPEQHALPVWSTVLACYMLLPMPSWAVMYTSAVSHTNSICTVSHKCDKNLQHLLESIALDYKPLSCTVLSTLCAGAHGWRNRV